MRSIQRIVQAKMVLAMCFSALAYPVSPPKSGDSERRDCRQIYQILGASLIAGSIFAAAISYLEKDPHDRGAGNGKVKIREMPKSSWLRIRDLSSDQQLFSDVSDLADYLIDKYNDNSKLSAALKKYLDTHPQEAMAALTARHGLTERSVPKAKELLEKLGPKAQYALTFAWIIGAVYNEREKAPEKTLRDVILGIEKEIDGIDFYTH